MITYYGIEAKAKDKDYILNLLAHPPEAIAVDVETVSLKERMPLGFAIAFSPEEAIYFPTYPEPTREIELLKPCLFNPSVCKIAHNMLFDMGVLPMIPGMEGFDRSNFFDTNTAARLLGRIQTDLPYLASENGEDVGIDVTSAKSMLVGKKTMLDIDPVVLADKCQRDARATYALYLKYKPQIDAQYKEYFKVEMAVIPILIDLSMRGIAIDQVARADMEAKLEDDVSFYHKVLTDAGIEKPGSPQQVGYILGKRGNFLPFTKGKRQLSTREGNLEFLDDPLATAILEFRGKSKLLNTYIKPIAGQDRFYCLHPNTRVLKADLSWCRIGNIKSGDEVVAINKQSTDGRDYKMIRDTVQYTENITAPAFRITTNYGEVIASEEHPWLCIGRTQDRTRSSPISKSRGTLSNQVRYYFKGGAQWITTNNLKPGDTIKYVAPPWEEDSETWIAGYLAGISDGEGYASNTHVGIVQKPGDTWQWILFMLEEAGFKGYVTEQNKIHKTMCVRFNMTESMRFLGVIRPRRLLQNAYKVWENRKPVGYDPAVVISVTPVGNTTLVNMVTGTHTFIAEGMVTHNTEYYLDTVVGRLNSRNRNIQNIPPDCLHPTTRILKADLTWTAIAELSIGDKLIGVEEYPKSVKVGRRLLTTTVTAKWVSVLSAFVIEFDNGQIVVASGEHPWLRVHRVQTFNDHKRSDWIKTSALKPGMHIKFISKPWKIEVSRDAGYLAGLLDGEGSVGSNVVTFSQQQNIVKDKYISLLKDRGYRPNIDKDKGTPDQRCYNVRVCNLADAMRLLGTTRPERLDSNKVWVGTRPIGYSAVSNIYRVGEMELVNIETDTHTFIAEGFVTHNCRHILLPDNGCFTCGDYSREHLYILAQMSGDRDMLRILYDPDPDKADIHQHTAAKMGVSRKLAKTLNFAVAYGATAKTISEHAKIKDVRFCGKLLDDWFMAYRGVADWVTTVQRSSMKSGWSEPTLFGRRIAIPEEYNRWGALYTEGMERKAVNYPVLGSDGEVVKRAIILCNSKGLGPPVMAVTVHDSIDLDGDHQFPVEELEMIPGFTIPFEVKQTIRWE